jgi:hypothetical protein
MAPELLLDVSGARTDKSDVYALAITIWEVCAWFPGSGQSACIDRKTDADLHYQGAFLSHRERSRILDAGGGWRATNEANWLREHRVYQTALEFDAAGMG